MEIQARIQIGKVSELKVGQRVFAVGNPRGLELTLTDGLVSGLRESVVGTVIQTSAAISPGSSGGGLFDGNGRLIGITTFEYVESQNLNFALPADWIAELPSRNRPLPKPKPALSRVEVPRSTEHRNPDEANVSSPGRGWSGRSTPATSLPLAIEAYSEPYFEAGVPAGAKLGQIIISLMLGQNPFGSAGFKQKWTVYRGSVPIGDDELIELLSRSRVAPDIVGAARFRKAIHDFLLWSGIIVGVSGLGGGIYLAVDGNSIVGYEQDDSGIEYSIKKSARQASLGTIIAVSSGVYAVGAIMLRNAFLIDGRPLSAIEAQEAVSLFNDELSR